MTKEGCYDGDDTQAADAGRCLRAGRSRTGGGAADSRLGSCRGDRVQYRGRLVDLTDLCVLARLRRFADDHGGDPDTRGHQRGRSNSQPWLDDREGDGEARRPGDRCPRQRADRAGRPGGVHREGADPYRSAGRVRVVADPAGGCRRQDVGLPDRAVLRGGRERLGRDPRRRSGRPRPRCSGAGPDGDRVRGHRSRSR